ncbi:hypothetical protein CL633_00750 [bacterium]|nr:hypothetical protein [bacterium]
MLEKTVKKIDTTTLKNGNIIKVFAKLQDKNDAWSGIKSREQHFKVIDPIQGHVKEIYHNVDGKNILGNRQSQVLMILVSCDNPTFAVKRQKNIIKKGYYLEEQNQIPNKSISGPDPLPITKIVIVK